MAKFAARIEYDQELAEEKLRTLGCFIDGFMSRLPSSCKAEMNNTRFTFCVMTLEAESEQECRELIVRAWEKFFATKNGISDIIIAPFGEDEELNSTIHTVFRSYYGCSDYIRLAAETVKTVPLLTKMDSLDILRQRNYLFAVDGGCGFSTLLSSFGDLLHKARVFSEEEYGSRTGFYEFRVGNESDNGASTVDDILSTVKDNSETHNITNYGIDISYYLDGRKFDELRSFINRLSIYQENEIFMFRIPFLEKKALDEVVGILSDQMMLKVVQIPPLSDPALLEVVWNVMRNKNFLPQPEIIETIRNRLHREKMDGRSYGFKTAKKLGSELVLEKAAAAARMTAEGGTPDDTAITPDDILSDAGTGKNSRTGYDALGELIGMEKISEQIKQIVTQVKYAISNEKLDMPCIHMRFTGAPGTGKTTVARIIGQILREEGVLRKGAFFEYGARELIAEYEGQTAVKTASICRDAYGSVLFIDEAYSFNEGKTNGADFGREALATLISEMENHRDDMLIVMAGYEHEMDELMKVNPGLRSRMPYELNFPNYTREQLFQIFMLMAGKHFLFDPSFEEEARRYFLSLPDSLIDSDDFANARYARNLYERTWSKGALRSSLAGKKEIVLLKEDLISAAADKEFGLPQKA
ncbi:MAG: AAA family ATPase [Ruminococcus sp.]|nr:AAA family ATPase [Ruminococcus sp.]